MIDLSDGLSEDLQRMCAASACGAVVELSKLPLARGLRHQEDGWSSALGEGEDYELLVALRPAEAKRALVDPVLTGAGIHEIGRIVGFNGRRGDKRIVWTVDGENMDIRIAGWEHQWK
jgi:thiamine-monophosphate kinase